MSSINLNNLQTLTNGSMTLEGGTYDFSGITDLDDTELTVEDGASLNLEGVTNYSNDDYYNGVPFTVSGGSNLDLSNLSSIANGYYGLSVTVSGANSVADLSSLSSFATYYGYTSTLSAGGGGTITLDPGSSGFSDLNITIDSTASIPLLSSSGFTSLTNSNLTAAGSNTISLDKHQHRLPDEVRAFTWSRVLTSRCTGFPALRTTITLTPASLPRTEAPSTSRIWGRSPATTASTSRRTAKTVWSIFRR